MRVGVDTKKCTCGYCFAQADVMALPFKKGKFEVVVALEVLEHLNGADLALKNISDVLGDKGILIVSTPANNLLWKVTWFFWVRSIGRMWRGEHKSSLTLSQWLNLFSAYFNVIDVRTHWNIDLIFKMKKNELV